MKFLLTVLILVTIWTQAHAHDSHHAPAPVVAPVVDPAPITTPTTITIPASNTYGLLALASSGNQFDWGVPDKLQLSVAGAFTEGGNQAISFGLGQRFGGVLINGHFAMTLNAPDTEDDYALVINGLMHF